MRSITVDGVNYTYGEDSIQAIHYTTSVCYEAQISTIPYCGSVINSENLFDMLDIGLGGGDKVISLEITRDVEKIELLLRYDDGRFVRDSVCVVLRKKKVSDVESLNHRVIYVNDRLNTQQESYESLALQVRELRDQLAEMEYNIRYIVKSARCLMGQGEYNYVPENMDCLDFSINSINFRGSVTGIAFSEDIRDNTKLERYREFSDNFMIYERLKYVKNMKCTNAAYLTHLDFAHTYFQLEKVEIDGCANLVDIGALVNTPVSEITLKNCPKVKNLEMLQGCQNLKTLKITNLANVRAIPEDVHFAVEYIA